MCSLGPWRVFAAVILLLAGAMPAVAQTVTRPQPSVLWAAAPEAGAPAGRSGQAAISRTDGLAIGAVIGGLAAGFLGYRMCQAYSALGDCWGTALWWGAVGGMLGGLIGASAAGENEPDTEADPERSPGRDTSSYSP